MRTLHMPPARACSAGIFSLSYGAERHRFERTHTRHLLSTADVRCLQAPHLQAHRTQGMLYMRARTVKHVGVKWRVHQACKHEA